MNIADVRNRFAFDAWANRQMVDAASRLTAEQFTRDLGASFGSVRGTLIHIMWGEKRWLYRWVHGDAVDRLPDPAPTDFPDCGSLQNAWALLNTERRTFTEQLTDDALQAAINVRGQTYSLAELIEHITNHSTYHRGQVVLLLRQLGQTPPATDFRLFVSESRAPKA